MKYTYGVFLFLLLVVSGCDYGNQPMFLEHRRPANVPRDATLVDQAKGGIWVRCMYDGQRAVNRCTVYNWGGGLIYYNEEYLPYDGGNPVLPSDLRIMQHAPLASHQVICLENGRMLLPKDMYERVKRDLDKVKTNR
jgi:hypothetical protein